MLPRDRRVRTPADFSQTLRSGARSGRRNVVVSALLTPGSSEPARAGFIVSKAIGTAVTRNLVKRRLRAAVAEELTGPLRECTGAVVVVRALPPAGQARWPELSADVRSALHAAVKKAGARDRDKDTARTVDPGKQPSIGSGT